MMVREVFRQLEAGKLVVGGDASHDARDAGDPTSGDRPSFVGRRESRVAMSEMLSGRPDVARSSTTAWRPAV